MKFIKVLFLLLITACVSNMRGPASQKATIAVPLPSTDFDPTEVAIPWLMLHQEFNFIFYTPDGKSAVGDQVMLYGKDSERALELRFSALKAREDAVKAYEKMIQSYEFKNPKKYEDLASSQADALLLPGGHASGMKIYLESKLVQDFAAKYLHEGKPVAAICHGVLVAARARDVINPTVSALYNRNTTGLLKKQELIAYHLTKSSMGTYYLTYPGDTVEDEVSRNIENESLWFDGPFNNIRDTPENQEHAFTIQDRNYLSARWPGDAHKLALEFKKMILDPNPRLARKISYHQMGKGVHVRVGEYLPKGESKGTVFYLIGYSDRFDNHPALFQKWLEQGYRVVSFDYPDHGESYGIFGENLNRLKVIQQFIIQLKDKMNISDNWVLAGWSTGSLLAMELLTEVDQLPKEIILYSPAIFVKPIVGDKGKVTLASLTRNPNPKREGDPKPDNTLLQSPLFGVSILNHSLQLRAKMELKLAKKRLEKIQKIPLRVFIDGQSQYIIPDDTQKWFEKHFPQSKIHFYPNAYHWMDAEPEPDGSDVIEKSSLN